MPEEFRICVHDDGSGSPEAVRVWGLNTKKDAIKLAKELCDTLDKEEDCLRNLFRYSVKVYRFWGTDLKFRDPPIFDSYKEYPHANVGT